MRRNLLAGAFFAVVFVSRGDPANSEAGTSRITIIDINLRNLPMGLSSKTTGNVPYPVIRQVIAFILSVVVGRVRSSQPPLTEHDGRFVEWEAVKTERTLLVHLRPVARRHFVGAAGGGAVAIDVGQL